VKALLAEDRDFLRPLLQAVLQEHVNLRALPLWVRPFFLRKLLVVEIQRGVPEARGLRRGSPEFGS
jgi:hypothetical protein